MIKPNKKRIRMLVKALRSGKYKQTRGTLRGQRGYCCLGVACEISGLGEWKATPIATALTPEKTYQYLGEDSSLPKAVQKFYGLSRNPALLMKNGEYQEAAQLNDESHRNFDYIADAFERTYLS